MSSVDFEATVTQDGEAIFTMVAGRLAHGPGELAVPAARSFGGWT